MNAANPSFDRDLDALHRAQRAYEPSMEEILASIRNIIADEKSGVGRPHDDPGGPSVAAAAPPMPTLASAPLVTSVATEAPSPAPPPPRVVWQQPSVEQRAVAAEAPEAPQAPVEPPPTVEEESLISRETDAAVSRSFDTLAVGLTMQNPAMLEAIVRDMIRPMLKTWLDDNLPSIVERLVRAEIQRVARGGR